MGEIGSIDGLTYLALLHEHAALKAEIERLRSDAERWRENLPLIVDIAEDLEGYIDQQWQSRDQYQDQRRKYDRDMESVRKLKEAIDAAREGE